MVGELLAPSDQLSPSLNKAVGQDPLNPDKLDICKPRPIGRLGGYLHGG